MSNIVNNTLAWISLILSKATLRPTRAPNKTPALAQEWAVWSKPTLDLMHVTLTARIKQRVYSKLVFKTYKKALCNWLRKLSKRNVEFHCKAQCATHNRRRFGQQAAAVVELNYDWLNCFTRTRNVQYIATVFHPNPGMGDRDWERS